MYQRLTIRQCCFLMSILASCILVQPPNVKAQSGSPSADSNLKDGAMQKIADVTRKVLRLKTPGGKILELDRESWEKPDDNNEKAIAIQVKQFMDRGMDRATAQRFAENMTRSRAPGPLSNSFAQLSGRGMTSMGSSVRGNVSATTCSGAKLRCAATFTGLDFEFKVTEIDGRELTFISTSKLIRIMLTDDDQIAILTQSRSGRVTGVLTGDRILTGSSADFRQFGNEHHELEQNLKQIFKHAGVDFPPSPHDPLVQQKVMSRVRSIYTDAALELDILIEELDASEFSMREAASEKIVADFERFESWIANRLADNSLAFEAKKRLDKIMKDAEKNKLTDARVDQCIDSNDLLRSPEYLIGLLDMLDKNDQTIVMKLLGDLTQEKFGDDAIAWQDWANSNQDDEKQP